MSFLLRRQRVRCEQERLTNWLTRTKRLANQEGSHRQARTELAD